MPNVGLLGLGVMGSGMAGRLLAAGFPLTVWNRTADRARPLEAAGARLAASPRQAAASADVIISMLADDDASRAAWCGDDGGLADAASGAVVIECSTVSPGWIAELTAAADRRGCSVLDAPVTGSRTHSANGELLFLVGGDPGVLERVRPVLTPMARGILHVGPGGSGVRLKLVNNFVCGVQAAALGEAVALIEALGLEREQALTVLAEGAPGSPLVKVVAPRMRTSNYDVNFQLRHMRKDLAYAVAEAGTHGVPLATAEAARGLFEEAIAAGWGSADFAAVVEAVRKNYRPT